MASHQIETNPKQTLIHSIVGDILNSLQLQMGPVSVFRKPLVSSSKFGRVTNVYRGILEPLHTNSGIETLNLATTTSIPRHFLVNRSLYIFIPRYREQHLIQNVWFVSRLQIPYQIVQSVVTCSGHFTTTSTRTVTRRQFSTYDQLILGSIIAT